MSKNNEKENYYSSLTGFKRAMPIILAAIAIFIGVCYFADGTGILGQAIVSTMFGLFSYTAYLIPFLILFHAIFYAADVAKDRCGSRVAFSIITVLLLSAIEYNVAFWGSNAVFDPVSCFTTASNGGFIGSSIGYALVKMLGPVGLIILAVAILAIYATFFFADRAGALGRGILTALGGLFGTLAKGEKKVKGAIDQKRVEKEKKRRRAFDKSSAKLLDDSFFEVDNGMSELKIDGLDIHEVKRGETFESEPSLQSSVYHKSGVATSLYDDTQEASTKKHAPKTLDLNYGLEQSAAPEQNYVSSAPVGNTQKPSRDGYGIDEAAENVFTKDFDPFDFATSQKNAQKPSSKAPAIKEELDDLTAFNGAPREMTDKERRIAELEQRKQQWLERKEREVTKAAEAPIPMPAPATAANEAPANAPVAEATPLQTSSQTVTASELTPAQPAHPEPQKIKEFNISTEKQIIHEDIRESASVSRTLEKPEYKEISSDIAATEIAQRVAMNNPGYMRSANEMVTYMKVTDSQSDSLVADNTVPEVSEPAYDTVKEYGETAYAEHTQSADMPIYEVQDTDESATVFTPTVENEFKQYTPPAAPVIDESAYNVKSEDSTLTVERTLLSPTPAPAETPMPTYDVVDDNESEQESTPEAIQSNEIVWADEVEETTEDAENAKDDEHCTYFTFEEETDDESTDESNGPHSPSDDDGEDIAEEEEIPLEEQNPDVLKYREMFSALRSEEIPTQDTNADAQNVVEDDMQKTSYTSDNEDDTPPFDAPTLVNESINEVPAPAPTPAPVATPAPAAKEIVPVEERPSKPDYSDYVFPPMDLLAKDEGNMDENIQAEIQENADRLIETLASFGVTASMKGVDRGPRITRYEVVPAKGVKVSSILNLQDDIALNLAAGSIRMEAPIPGKSAVGIEIPNKKSNIVRLRELLETNDFTSQKSKTAVCIGKDVAGQPVFGDIAKMPHLLIAGATGMGKSVCINALLISILYKARPDEVKLIMIDPKQVEFTMYNGIPHLLVPVVTDAKQAAGVLMWAVEEMERRYNMLQPLCVRNIDAYNEKVSADPSLGEPMPSILIVIDEFADLMLQVKDPVEKLVTRIAAKARAAGIHLIIGTQRPSVDVITGVIKANVPSRIACKVMSNVDSKTVLDSGGAEKLLDKGDSLYAPSGSPKPHRVQCAFVADSEVEAIMSYLRQFATAGSYDSNVMADIERAAQKCSKKGGGSSDDDESEENYGNGYLNDRQFLDAVEIAVNTRKISTALLQRKLSIGYGKAAKFIDIMEEMGVVSEPNGQRAREVLLTPDEWREKLARTTYDE